METLAAFGSGFLVALDPINLVYLMVGVTLGTLIGVLPGLGPSLTIALLLPLTSGGDAAAAMIMFAGIYYGAMYGGSTTSILINTPGESASVVTALEGYQMSRRGRAGAALATAAIGSFVAGTLSVIALVLFSPILVRVALGFGPAEYFALMVLALAACTGLFGNSLSKGLASLFIGMAIALVGIDLQTGQARYTFGIPEFLDGITVVNVAVGLFGIGNVLWIAATYRNINEERVTLVGKAWMNLQEWRRSWKPWLRGSVLGFSVGSLPAGGADIPVWLSYNMERNLSKNKEEWGNGAIEGVAGPEAANNAASSGTMLPLLTLGLPTSTTAAILLAAFIQFGVQPGPMLFQNRPDLVWGLIASFFLGNIALLALNLPLIRVWVRVLDIPYPLLYSGILIFATLGAWSIGMSVVDMLVMFGVGLLSLVMRWNGIPLAPAILGVVLGLRLEQQFRQAMAISMGDITTFITRPISASILLIAVLLLLLPVVWRTIQKYRVPADSPAAN